MKGTFVKADWYYDPYTGLNITRVYITGVPGDVANITNALRVCNRYNVPVKIRIADVSLLQNIYGARYTRNTAVKIVDPSGAADSKVVVQDGAAVDTAAGYVALAPGQCAVLGVDIIIDANTPCYKTLAAYQINIEKVPQYDVA
jgi:hypothetical protein